MTTTTVYLEVGDEEVEVEVTYQVYPGFKGNRDQPPEDIEVEVLDLTVYPKDGKPFTIFDDELVFHEWNQPRELAGIQRTERSQWEGDIIERYYESLEPDC